MTAIGIDVGGTFTDFVTIDDAGSAHLHKHLTTAADPSLGVLDGVAELSSRSDLEREDVRRIIHGTTLVANSLIERRGARAALVTTCGFRDVIEIGRESRYDLYDLDLERPRPLIDRPLRLEVDERIRADGTVLDPLIEDEAERVAARLLELGAESVAITLINAYANPAHERMLAEVIARVAPGVDVTLSSAVAPEWREYERSSTAAANAFVRPLVRRYLARLDEGFETTTGDCSLNVLLSQGGMTSAGVAAELAVQLVESGPAAGVMAAAYFGRRIGLDDLISFDMGGTTTKVSLIERGQPLRVPELEVARVARFKRGSGLPLKIPAIELVEIGAGGGSIGRVDSLGLLKVGPQSAGADPGPACYGRGGEEPTVTDADLFLGILNADYFLGGEMKLDCERAEDALARVGAPIGLDAEATARGIFDIVNSQMALALQTHVVERGQDPRRFALVAFGGAGPVHAYEVARRLGIARVICPPAAGVASALGLLISPFAVDLVRTYPAREGAIDWTEVAARYSEMESEAKDLLERSGANVAEAVIERSVDMRYAGQGYTVPVPIPDDELSTALEPRLRAAFNAAYERRFGSHLRTSPVEALHWRLTARVPVDNGTVTFAEPTPGDPRKGQRDAYFPELGTFLPCDILDRYAMTANTQFDGPVLVEERESTVVVGPAGSVQADELGNLLITIRSRSG